MLESTTSEKLYTTGELAQLCDVTVRTVQYYDQKELLHPTERSEGGRRLYDEAALERLRTICFLKSLGLTLKAIRGVLTSDNSDAVLACLLEEQERALNDRIADDKHMLQEVQRYQAAHTTPDPVPQEQSAHTSTEASVDHNMSGIFAEKGTRLHNTQRKMLMEGIVLSLVEWACIIGGVITGNWWPFIAALPLIVIITAELVWMYHRDARYICPHCHATFQPAMREFLFANHTPKTRKLTCTACHTKDWCVETTAERSADATQPSA